MQDNISLSGKLSRWVACVSTPGHQAPIRFPPQAAAPGEVSPLPTRAAAASSQLLVGGTTRILWRGGGHILTRALCCSIMT